MASIRRSMYYDHGDEAKIEVIKLDLQSLDSIKEFVREYTEVKKYPLHYLFNNAGIAHENAPEEKTRDGFEIVWQVNHLGHFLLSSLLFKVMRESAPAAIINVSSAMHEAIPKNIDFNIVSKQYSSKRYGISKFAQILFSFEFQRRHSADSNVQSIAVHPGAVNSDIWNWLPNAEWLRWIVSPIFLSTEDGAHVALGAGMMLGKHIQGKLLYCTPYPQIIRGQLSNEILCLLTCRKPGVYSTRPSELSFNPLLATKLWESCEKSLEIKF